MHTHLHTNEAATGSNLGFRTKDTSTCGLKELGIEPQTFWLVDNPLYLLSHSCPRMMQIYSVIPVNNYFFKTFLLKTFNFLHPDPGSCVKVILPDPFQTHHTTVFTRSVQLPMTNSLFFPNIYFQHQKTVSEWMKYAVSLAQCSPGKAFQMLPVFG